MAAHPRSDRRRVYLCAGGSLGWCAGTIDQIAHTVRQRSVVDHKEDPAPPILVNRAVSRQRAFLVHIAENRIVMASRCGDANLRVIGIGGTGTAF